MGDLLLSHHDRTHTKFPTVPVLSGNTYVFGNTDANVATAEFSIVLNGSITLTAADFIL